MKTQQDLAAEQLVPGNIRPTIGRQVWFWNYAARPGIDQPEAGTICYVHGDSLVNLQVIEYNGVARSELEVSLRQPNDPEWTGRHCEWMPYQKGQATKTEQLETDLEVVRRMASAGAPLIHVGNQVEAIPTAQPAEPQPAVTTELENGAPAQDAR